MPHNLIKSAVFVAGLAALCWIGVGYLGSNPFALSMVLLIGACYVAGGLELRRYSQATASLATAVAQLSGPVPNLGDWLAPLPALLRHAVRQRVEGGRVSMPAPALTPYLVGLLVLLGMLGTLLGMMATLRGTGLALASATDLDAIRTSLAMPVKGLAFAFGTSIAGVAASAMLGLVSALCRRERAAAVQALDAAIATVLRPHSEAHRREATFRLLQQQVDVMPVLVDRLQAAMDAVERQSRAAHESQLAQQAAFHERTEAVHERLAASVERSLRDSVAESARAAGAALQPVVETTMAALAHSASSLHESVLQTMQRQFEGLSGRMHDSTTRIATLWTDALAQQRQSNEALLRDLHASLERFSSTFEQRSAGLVEQVSARFEAASHDASAAWTEALSRQSKQGEALADRNERALTAAAAAFESHAASLIETVRQSNADVQAKLDVQAQASAGLVADVATRFDAASERAVAAWSEALARQAEAGEALAERNERALNSAAATFESHAVSLVGTVQQSHAELQAALDVQTRARARDMLAEVARLVHDAAEAPKAAAEVIAELRRSLSESMARDTAMLEERGRLLATVETLLGAVNHAAAEQRTAVDALISTSAEALERVATRFTAHVEAETGKLDAAADRVTAGVIEVASLGDVFASAVERFGEANGQLVTRLHSIESALDQSLARSDEQLAYYVAQARDVVDLSVLAQKQIIGELQQLAQARLPAGADAA